jgi:PAX-interacting protein 1
MSRPLSLTCQPAGSLSLTSAACSGSGSSGATADGTDSRTYYGHDSGEHVPDDVCLLGCVFYIGDYQKCLDPLTLDIWKQVISSHGGQVDDSYSNRITHVLCEHQKSDVFQLALRDGKRLVTAYWLNDCLLARRMFVPDMALHLPYIFGKERPCSNQVICMTNFEGDERQHIKQMIAVIGAKYTGYMSRANSVLIAKRPDGAKYEKAVEWGIPVVGVQWLTDLILGDLEALKVPVQSCYMSFNGDDTFHIDCGRAAHLLDGWKSPLKISKETWKKFQSSQSLRLASTTSSLVLSNQQSMISGNESTESVVRVPACLNQQKMPVVLLTGFTKDRAAELSKAVIRLGGQLAHSAAKGCTHLVANSVLRTVKFLSALGVVRHIVTSNWIEQSSIANHFLDENHFHLQDEKMESTLNFKLQDSLQRASKTKLFQNLAFFFTPGVEPNKNILGSIVRSCDGHIVDRLPPLKELKKCVNYKGESTFVIISCIEDLYLCQDIIYHDIAVHNVEFTLTGVLRQQLDYTTYRIG